MLLLDFEQNASPLYSYLCWKRNQKQATPTRPYLRAVMELKIYFISIFVLLNLNRTLGNEVGTSTNRRIFHGEDLPVENSTGIYFEVEDGQLWYEATAPVIYRIRLPSWPNFLALPASFQNLNCSDNNQTPSSPRCAVLHSFQKIAEEIQLSLEEEPLSPTVKSTWGLKCNYLSKHFSSKLISPEVEKKYLTFLRSCSKGMILEEPPIPDFQLKPNLTLFQDLEHAWNFNYFNNTSLQNDHDAVEAGELESILTIGLTNFVTETTRWNSAFSKCSTGHLPESLITPERFHASLLQLNETVGNHGYRFVIPPEAGFLPVYYKSEHFTDCSTVLTENGTGMELIVRVLVPIVKSSSDWKHVTVKTIPFVDYPLILYFDKFDNPKFTSASGFLFDNSTKSLFSLSPSDCDVTRPGFCRVPQFTDPRRYLSGGNLKIAHCVKEMLSEGYGQPTTSCDSREFWKSLNISGHLEALPVVVSENIWTFYVAGVHLENTEQDYDILIICRSNEGTGERNFYYRYPNSGALKVKLGCGCHSIEFAGKDDFVIEPELDMEILYGCEPETEPEVSVIVNPILI